jgi:hypothetical protein
MSHVCGTVPDVNPNFQIGPDTGAAANPANTWAKSFPHTPAPTGTKFVVLHFKNVDLPGDNRLEVDLGYDTDIFTAADGGAFWTRPIDVAKVGASIPIRYVTPSGNHNGIASIDRYGRAESLLTNEPLHNSITNCNPFMVGGWKEPDFPHIMGSTEPRYDSHWICDKNAPPKWTNIRCAADNSIQRTVAKSVGMIVTVHEADPPKHPIPTVSGCTVTLIDSDLVVTAAHCIEHFHFEVPTSSVTFDYEVQCDGSLVPAYNAVFYKVIKLVKFRFTDDRDYAVLQLRGAPPVPPVPVRITEMVIGEDAFCVHHPNGAVKKVSPVSGMGKISAVDDPKVDINLDISGGSSGGPLFDAAGAIVGVLVGSSACDLSFCTMRTMMADPIQIPDPPTERAVMLVIDRSGSMSDSAGGGKVKLAEAKAAAELFVSMVRTTGNRMGFVSFSNDASDPVDSALAAVNAGAKTQMTNKLGGINAGGATSIGDGLIVARDQLGGAMGLPKSILLLTDGMENTPEMIASVTGLGGIEITALGFGAESNLDGPRLTKLAQDHGGFYKRAGTGLELRKFFALAFGDIFEAGALADPMLHLPADDPKGDFVPFDVCAEEAVTIVVGWSDENTPLLLELVTPSGQFVNLAAAGIETGSGKAWRFARVPLPQNGEREGVWKTRVARPGGSVEFPPGGPAVDYFVNVIARGGPSLRPFQQPKRLYTGDILHPRVILQFPDESTPPTGTCSLSLRRPAASVGTILAQNGLGPAKAVAGDVIPPRQATLQEIEKKTGKPVTGYIESGYALTASPEGSGMFRAGGIYGRRLENVLVVDGNYSFHAKARVGLDCVTTRECQWSLYVAVGIDPGSTPVTTTPGGTGPGGGDRVTVTFTPKDRYGNLVGPGAGDDFEVTPLPGGTPLGVVVDNGDGSYSQDVELDEDGTPGVVVNQPDRDPVVVVPPSLQRRLYRYTATLICGGETGDCCGCASVGPGRYATAITVYNPGRKPAKLVQRVVPTTFAGATSGRWPDSAGPRAEDTILLAPGEATTIDCCSVGKMLLGAAAPGGGPLTYGLVTLDSAAEVEVHATYTVTAADGGAPSIDVERIAPIEAAIREPVPRPPAPPAPPPRPSPPPPPRPQDVPRRERPKPQPEKEPPARKPRKRKT